MVESKISTITELGLGVAFTYDPLAKLYTVRILRDDDTVTITWSDLELHGAVTGALETLQARLADIRNNPQSHL